MPYATFLLVLLGLTCYAVAVPLTEDSNERAQQQTLDNGARKVNEASFSRDLSDKRSPPRPEEGRSWLRHSKDWQGQAEQQGEERVADEEAQLEMISSLLQDIGNSELNSSPEDTDNDDDGDDLQAELENFNLVNKEPGEDQDSDEDGLTSDEAEAQKWRLFRSILGKGLRVLKHKLRSRSRTREEDRRAVNDPTSLKDLARNILGTVGDKLDPRDTNDVPSDKLTNEEAEIEKIKIFKKLFKKIKKGVKKAFKIFRKVKPLIKSRRRSRNRDEDDDCRRSYRCAHAEYDTSIRTDVGFYKENELAEMEGLRSFLVNALRLVNTKLRPNSRTVEEDREAVRNPKKWTDLGRNFLDRLREKLEQRRNRDTSTTENEPTTEFPTDAIPYGVQPWTTDQPDSEVSQAQSLYKIFKKIRRLIRRNRSG